MIFSWAVCAAVLEVLQAAGDELAEKFTLYEEKAGHGA